MTFKKPTFVKPDAAIIAGIDYWDIYIEGLKIGVMTKTPSEIHLNIMYNDFVLNTSEKSQIMTVIEVEYTRLIFHVLGSVGKIDIHKWKGRIDEKHQAKELRSESKSQPINEMKIIE